MASYGNQFYAALRDIFGAATTDNAASVATYAAVKVLGPAEVYHISLIASASGVGTFQLIDATATGIGGTVKWGTTALPMLYNEDFTRPIAFSKGLVISYTATAALTLNSTVQYSPRYPS